MKSDRSLSNLELWLARDIVADNPQLLQKSMDKLTPRRVAQAMGGVLAVIGTPTLPPKPRGSALLFDQDGNASEFTQVQFAQLSTGLSLTNNNFVVV